MNMIISFTSVILCDKISNKIFGKKWEEPMKKIILFSTMIVTGLLLLASCGAMSKDKELLDPENPVTISVWNYYNGSVKDKFDSLVSEFNDTVGAEKGIVVEAQSYGDVNQLADAVYDSAEKDIGSMPMPDIFAAYPDGAFRINQVSELVTLSDYFSKEELGEINQGFLTEGTFGSDHQLKILPIAKSTENIYLNKTYWDEFAAKTGASLNDLSTWEGLVKTAKNYHELTGKAFFGIDANANYMLVSAMQLGQELYQYQGDTATLNFSEDTAYRIWQSYYVPYINGYFAKTGRFSSDDAKTGLIAAYTGSTAGASYFPTAVAEDETSKPIEVITLPYPTFQGGKQVAIQQGAGMCITESDEPHEYAASVFLKWFISEPQNLQFAVATGYMPVKTEALNTKTILSELDRVNISTPAVKDSIKTTVTMFKTYSLYGNQPFVGSYKARAILETSLLSRVNNDLKILNERVQGGEKRQSVIDELSSKEQFLNWYKQFTDEMQAAMK